MKMSKERKAIKNIQKNCSHKYPETGTSAFFSNGKVKICMLCGKTKMVKKSINDLYHVNGFPKLYPTLNRGYFRDNYLSEKCTTEKTHDCSFDRADTLNDRKKYVKDSMSMIFNSNLFERDSNESHNGIVIGPYIVKGVDYHSIPELDYLHKNSDVSVAFRISSSNIGDFDIRLFISKYLPFYGSYLYCRDYKILPSERYVLILRMPLNSNKVSLDDREFDFAMKLIHDGIIGSIFTVEDVMAIKMGTIVSQISTNFDRGNFIRKTAWNIASDFISWYNLQKEKNKYETASSDDENGWNSTMETPEDDPEYVVNKHDLHDEKDHPVDNTKADDTDQRNDEENDNHPSILNDLCDNDDKGDNVKETDKEIENPYMFAEDGVELNSYTVYPIRSVYIKSHPDIFDSEGYYYLYFVSDKMNDITNEEFREDVDNIFGVSNIVVSCCDRVETSDGRVGMIAEFDYPENVLNWHLHIILDWYKIAVEAAKKEAKENNTEVIYPNLIDFIKLSGYKLNCYLYYYKNENYSSLGEELFPYVQDEKRGKKIYDGAYRFRVKLRKLLNDPTL